MFLFTEVFAHGGIQRFNQTLLHSCQHMGVEGQVMSLNDSPASIARQSTPGNFPIVGFSGNRRRFAFAVALAILRGRHEYVLIGHINLLLLTVLVLILRPFRRTSALLVAHGIEVWSDIGWTRGKALARVSRILCVSNYTRQRILEQAPGLIAEHLILFPNALASTWSRIATAAPTRALPENFILSVTRLDRGDRYKGIATVIEAFSMLTDDTMQYFVVGHGNDLAFLQLIARRFGVEDRVRFLSGVSDSELIALYQNCRAFVLPSGKEGFGIVFLEAMFFGAPVIAAAEKGTLDVVRNHETGLTVDFGDTIALKRAIERIASDRELREHMRLNGRSLVVDDGSFTAAAFTRRCAAAFGVEVSSGA